MGRENPVAKLLRYRNALALFVERLKQDRYVLAAVLVGSLCEETIWRRESIDLWILEADGVTRRRKFDDEDKRLFRRFSEEGVSIHAEVIPRARFRRMIEGTSRTAFTHSFFAHRELLYSADASLARWFAEANTLATRDQETSLFIATTWLIHPLKYIDRVLAVKQDWELARQELIFQAWCLAAIEIVQRGEIYEEEIIYRGIACNPELFKVVYEDLIAGPAAAAPVRASHARVLAYLDEYGPRYLAPVVATLRKKGRMTALSELADDYAHSQVYPGHLETACEWLADRGVLSRFSMPMRLTTKSHIDLEEPAYELRD